MKRLLLAAALAPLSFAAAQAQTTISTPTTTPLATSTSGDITIESGGSIAPATSSTAGTVAITINSNNNVTNNGSITVTETTTGDSTNQGIANGPFANGADRFGIQVIGAGPFTGSIDNATGGIITVIGENSADIDVETGLNGSITQAGTISIIGGNVGTTDVSYGIFTATTAPISGNVSVSGLITATGANATGVALNGGVGGSVDIDSTITATGFRDTTEPPLEATRDALTPDQLLIGGPALSIGGSVAGGVSVDAAVAAVGNVAATTGGTLTVFGSAPALLIGGASPITIGAGANGYGLTVGGAINAVGTYPDVNGEGIQIGGVNTLAVSTGGVAPGGNFSSVFITGGINISGSVQATAIGNTAGGGVVTALEIGPNVTVPRITNSGDIIATGQNTLLAGDTPAPTIALSIDAGAPAGATTLVNSGNITAFVTGVAGVAGVSESSGGNVGNATAIYDPAGGLTQIVNTGNITAAISPAITGETETGPTTAIFAANTAPLTITQCTAVDSGGDCLTTGNATFTPAITGDVNLSTGTGAQTLNIWGGNLTGAVEFGSNAGNALDIENSGLIRGPLSVAGAGQVAINVNSGQLFDTAPGNVSVSSLHIGSTGSIVFTGDPLNPNGSVFNVSGNATLDNGAGVGLALTTTLTSAETFTVIQTGGNLTAGNISTVVSNQIPFLETGTITTTANSLSITATPKTAAQLGFNPAEASEFPAFTAALASDPELAADVLSKTNRPSLIHVYDQFLPDYAGGPFEDLVVGQQEIGRAESEAPVKLQSNTTRGWVQEIGYLNNENASPQVNGFQGLGFGFAAGIERARGDQVFGVAASFLTTGVHDQTQPTEQSLTASAFEIGAYWRKGGGQPGLNVSVNANGGLLLLGSQRDLIDEVNDNDLLATQGSAVSRQAKASWIGGIASANVAVGYQFGGARFFARPEVSLDYIGAYQSAYREKGGGPAFNLNIASQTASQADAQADIVLGMNFGQTIIWRPELTLGYRAVIAGGPSATTASFAGGQSFTISPEFNDKGGFIGRLGLRATGLYADFSADAGGEFSSGYQTYNARAAARFLF